MAFCVKPLIQLAIAKRKVANPIDACIGTIAPVNLKIQVLFYIITKGFQNICSRKIFLHIGNVKNEWAHPIWPALNLPRHPYVILAQHKQTRNL